MDESFQSTIKLIIALLLFASSAVVASDTETLTLVECVGRNCCGPGTIFIDEMCRTVTDTDRDSPDGFGGFVVLGVLTALVVVGVVSTAAATLTEVAPSFPVSVNNPTDLTHMGWEVQGAKEVYVQSDHGLYSTAIKNRFGYLKELFTNTDIAELYHEKLGRRGFTLKQDPAQQVELVVFQDGRRLWFPSSVLSNSPCDLATTDPAPSQIPSATVTPALTADQLPPTPATFASAKPLPKLDPAAR
eukprot:TRINITY_DN1236_c1_g1_i1.p1 TRINITY_DN1236_c1_g1~~TRINITY_DN1236_c1_g1_i1.p1  ORF type:complete len:272 (+),score=29.63 TRINITY_DN1236_c1_g1_i1:82-816(+)